ncbi:hypothetical protein GCM10007216_26600 [Thalassobacillus devorans]|uniref:YetF C-terminal domain-containing protein n=1 Tax=Thalassobacillus devorans TaxID=279813 RepID=A0ABQ1PCK4_9BACI|nr:DUF421 domain-containing protein [Thalassobacillus devorans]NIK29161.1 uncharacterized membrane protein YcaP (DUF421 family) [Thalassobacillus devorans]GGC94581.1 hypothetical protein GCM10007216_26600 [Thalassobacillus devorans]
MPEWIHIIYRGVLFLILLFLMTKLLGKKQISQLSFFEYISGITIGSIAAEVIMGLDNNIWHGIIGVAIFAVIPFFVEILSLHNKKIRDVVEGKGTVLIKDGKLLEDNLKKEKYTTDEILQLLRGKDVFQVNEVEYAVLEADGKLSVLLKKDNRPLTRKDIDLPSINEKEPHTIIMDGEMIDDKLASAGKNRAWLKQELDKQNVTIENVFLGQVDSSGQLTLDLYDDKIQVPKPQEKPLLLANMKKCQADLELFALATDSEKAKRLYAANARKLQESMDVLSPHLKG